ncbi:hypothetical protein [Methylophaga sp.]|jgi:hypothetical protein|uniref:hypothetical protein n=1 Tax=Methylophaga sp. TaxID=2024840 RepID=UPI00140178BB|nr:hypothetical protein [Methylophaga sp.]MTI63134.1 hypothetical protein [Methylophaga sp.]
MLFIIFTAEGLTQAQEQVLNNKAELWLNPSLKKQSDLSVFEQLGITLHTLPEEIDASNEKAVMTALSHVEAQSHDKDILVEYL